jgi:hypothetical protein
VLQFVYYRPAKFAMQKITATNDDGSTQDFFPQSYTDAAVQQALQNQAPVNTVTPDVSEVDLVLTDGSTKKFVAA